MFQVLVHEQLSKLQVRMTGLWRALLAGSWLQPTSTYGLLSFREPYAR